LLPYVKSRKGKPPGSSKEDLLPTAMTELIAHSCPSQADGWEGKAKVRETESSSISSHNSFVSA